MRHISTVLTILNYKQNFCIVCEFHFRKIVDYDVESKSNFPSKIDKLTDMMIAYENETNEWITFP